MTRPRRTKADLHRLDFMIKKAVAEDSPVTVRGVFYRVVSMGGILNLGDHDPSGRDIWRDFTRKITEDYAPGVAVTFKRVTPEQIIETDLPTRPSKPCDTRTAGFLAEFGHIKNGESVEVDAIPASTLRAMLDEAIIREIDHDARGLPPKTGKPRTSCSFGN